MNIYDATEQAYKNGFEDGKKAILKDFIMSLIANGKQVVTFDRIIHTGLEYGVNISNLEENK